MKTHFADQSPRILGVICGAVRSSCFVVTALAVLIILLQNSGCIFGGPPRFVERFSTVTIAGVESGLPLVGARVTLGNAYHDLFGGIESATVRPTDDNGVTYLVFVLYELNDSLKAASLTISADGSEETLEIELVDGASSQGDHFRVTMIDADSEAPPPASVQPVLGTNPPVLLVDSYVLTVGVCSNRTGLVTWKIEQHYGNSAQYYIDSVTVGSMPDGFENLIERIGGEVQCPINVSGRPEEGFTTFVGDFVPGLVTSDNFCLDSTGAAMACE